MSEGTSPNNNKSGPIGGGEFPISFADSLTNLCGASGVILLVMYLLIVRLNGPSPIENDYSSFEGSHKNMEEKLHHLSRISFSNEKGNPLHYAIARNDVESVKRILKEKKLSVDGRDQAGCTPLLEAARVGNKEIVQLLVNNNAYVNAPNLAGETPLLIAALQGHLDVTRFLVDRKADVRSPSSDGSTPLSVATEQGHTSLVKFLHKAGADLDHTNAEGETALSLAVRFRHPAIVKYLSEQGANVNIPNNSGESPLFIAIHNNKPGLYDTVRFLLENGANSDAAPTVTGCTPLCMAVTNERADIVGLLLTHNANINKPLADGTTPLHIAIQQQQYNIAMLLVKAGASLYLPDYQGTTPLSLVKDKEFAKKLKNINK